MSNFRTKILGLAAVATAFAGMSYAQNLACAVQPGANPSLRAEGETELLADLIATCTNTAGPATNGTLFITASAPITSKAVTIGVTPSNEATLLITTNGTVAAGGTLVVPAIQGTVTGNQVSFSIPAGGLPVASGAGAANTITLQVANIRVNASAATNPQITETALLSYATGATSTNLSLTNPLPYNAGFVLSSLGATSLVPLGTTNYMACVGNAGIPTVVAPGTSFTVNIKELFSGAFKTGGAAPGGEGGSYVPMGANTAGIGTATTGTQIQIVLGNLPAASTIYVPAVVADPNAGGTVLSIANAVPIATGLLAGKVSYTPVGGSVTLTYTVTAVGSAGAVTFPVPVIVSFAANSSPAQTAVTVLTSYAPTGVVTGPAAAVPTFAASTATPVNGSKITACTTTLLFPYVTNASGFETGIAVSNTTTDNLGTIPGIPSAASPVNGTCTLNFYGNAAQPTATVTPTLGAYTTAAPTTVPVYANTLTALVGSSGFTGYAIASCNFLDGHGFAFITDASGTFSGAMGYLATVIPAGRSENGADSTSLTANLTLTLNAAVGGVQSGTATGSVSGTTTPSVGQ